MCDEIGDAGFATMASCGMRRDSNRLPPLARLYRSHIGIEEHGIFPSAQAALSGPEKAAIGRSMASRRGIAVIPEEVLIAWTPKATG